MVEQPQQCQAALQALLAQRVDALLVNVPLDDATPNSSGRWHHPFRCCFLMSPSAQVNSLVFNAAQGASGR
jgi:DNA-binding LacI/PurR family transcriptional regulator